MCHRVQHVLHKFYSQYYTDGSHSTGCSPIHPDAIITLFLTFLFLFTTVCRTSRKRHLNPPPTIISASSPIHFMPFIHSMIPCTPPHNIFSIPSTLNRLFMLLSYGSRLIPISLSMRLLTKLRRKQLPPPPIPPLRQISSPSFLP